MAFRKFNFSSCFAFAMLAGVGGVHAAGQPSFIDNGVLKVCTAGDFPPMQFYKNPGDKEMVGYEIDVVDALAKQWNARAEYIVSDFKGLLPSLDAGRCGMVASGILLTPTRLETHDGIAHFNTSVVLLTSSQSRITTPEELSGQTIAIEGGTTYDKTAADLNKKLASEGKPEIIVQGYPGASAVIQQILVGRAVATITQDTTAAFRGAQVPGRLSVPYTFPGAETYGIYIRKNADDLTLLKRAFESIKADGTLGASLTKWGLPVSAIDVKQPAN